jgi:hypothetical protein
LILVPKWLRRKRGTPRQIGQPFIADESQQKKKGMLDKLRERFGGQEHGRQENKYLERLKALIKERTIPKEELLLDGLLTPEDVEYLERKGLAEIDPFTESVVLTDKGVLTFLEKRIARDEKEAKENPPVRLTEKEKAWLRKKVDEEES